MKEPLNHYQIKYINLIFLTIGLFEIPKIFYILSNIFRGADYYIANTIKLNSSNYWILAHSIVSIIYVLVLAYVMCQPILTDAQQIVFYTVSFMMLMLIFFNDINLGTLPPYQAILVNNFGISVITVLEIFHKKISNNAMFAAFVVITLPVMMNYLVLAFYLTNS